MDLQAFDAAKYGRAPFRPKASSQIHVLEHPSDPKTTYSGEDIIVHVEDFYRNLFNLSNPDILPMWIYDVFKKEDLDCLGFFDGATLQNLILEMPLGKVGTEDAIVVEILRQLDTESLDVLADAFRLRLINHPSEVNDDSWQCCVANLVAKVPRPTFAKQFRPIAILPVLSKLFSKLIALLAKPHMRQLRAPQFAFTPGHQPHEVIFILRTLIERAIEWNIPIWILDGDIQKAYDNTQHNDILEAILEADCPPL